MRTFRILTFLAMSCTLNAGQTAAPAASGAKKQAKSNPAKRDSDTAMNPIDSQRESIRQQMASVQKQASSVVKLDGAGTKFIEPMQPSTLGPSPISFVQPDCPRLSGQEADLLISSTAAKEQLSPDLLRAVINRESGFKPCVVSEKGAQGLMQLMPETAREFNVADPFDPVQNVAGGAALLKRLLTHYSGDVASALGAYNAGTLRVDEAGGVPEIDETEHYVSGILTDLSTAAAKVPENNAVQSIVLQVSLRPDQISPATVKVSASK
jgi:soluble lytic murein transglycosylase-like protein